MANPCLSVLYQIGKLDQKHQRFIKWVKQAIPEISITEFSSLQEVPQVLNKLQSLKNVRILLYCTGIPNKESLSDISITLKELTETFEYSLTICEVLYADWFNKNDHNLDKRCIVTTSFSDPGYIVTPVYVYDIDMRTLIYPRVLMIDGYIPYFIYALSLGILSQIQINQTDAAELLQREPQNWNKLIAQIQVRPAPNLFIQ